VSWTSTELFRVALPGWRGVLASHGALVALSRHLVIVGWPGIASPPGVRPL
jgi:hypothetical protein